MANTKVLNITPVEFGENGATSYVNRVEDENTVNSNYSLVDAWAGAVTGSMASSLFLSGSVAGYDGQVVWAEYATVPRTITQVVAFAHGSGSGGVTSVDVQLSSSANGFQSIYANAAARAKVSSSLGNYGMAISNSQLTSSWAAGQLMRVVLATDTVNQSGLSVNVCWKPSASYG